MFFKVPVAYQSTVVMPRCQKEEARLFGEWIEVHVAEVSPESAPVAMRWKPDWVEQAPNGMHETRWFDGAHWKPVTYQYGREQTQQLTVAMLRQFVEEGRDYSNPLRVGFAEDMARGKLSPEAELAVRRMVSSGRDRAVAKAHEKAESLMFVDGLAWQRGHEPIYKFSRGPYISIGDSSTIEHPENVFAADRWDDMLHHYTDGMEDLNDKFDASNKIDVLVPESVRFDDETPAIKAFLTRAVGFIGDKEVARLPIDRMVAWARFRDAVEAMNEAVTPRTIAAAIAAAEENVRMNYGENDGYYSGAFQKALRRWEMRPVRSVDVMSEVAPSTPAL